MPGDVREQQIGVRTTGVKSQVRVFVRAVVDHETAHLLSPITLTATVGDASAGWLQTGTPGSVFAYPTQIATFTSDDSTVLNLQLSVPTSVGNELADANKTIRWEITAEDDGEKIPVQSADSKKPGLLGLAGNGRQHAHVAFSFANSCQHRFYSRATFVRGISARSIF